MTLVQRVLDDLKRGENIDLYLTISASLIVALLNLIGLAPSNLFNSLSLAVLALLASSILGIRHQLADIREKVGQAANNGILEDFPNEMDNDFARASEIWILGTTLGTPLSRYYKLLGNKLREGKRIYVLLPNPDSPSCAMVAARMTGKVSVERMRTNINDNLDNFVEMRQVAPTQLQIKVIDYPLAYGAYMLNPDGSDGVIYLRQYLYQGAITPKHIYRPRDPWFELTKQEIHSMWDQGTEWNQ